MAAGPLVFRGQAACGRADVLPGPGCSGLGQPRPDLLRRVIGGKGGKDAHLNAAASRDGRAVLCHGNRCLKIISGHDRIAAELGGLPGLTKYCGRLKDRPAGVNDAGGDDIVDECTPRRQNGDVDGLVALLTEDVLMTMPPIPLEYLGRELVARFLRAAIFGPGIACRPVPTRANGQPALVMYLLDQQSGTARATGLLVFTLSGSRVSAITRFDDTVLPRFGVPATLPG